MQITLIMLIMILSCLLVPFTNCLQILLQSEKETCFALRTEIGDRINLHIYSHDKTDYQYFKYFILDPDNRPILRKPKLNTDLPIIRNHLKAQKEGKY